MHSRSCTGVVLAGGTSTRFGGAPKGLAPLGGVRIVDRVLAAVGAATDDVVVIANDPAIARQLTHVRVCGDTRPERASLVGLCTALSQAGDPALVVAWDMPFVNAELLRELRRIGEESATAVVPEGPAGPEPLCAYYPRSSLAIVEQQLAHGDLRLGTLLEALPGRVTMPLADVARFGEPERLFANVNSISDLAAAERWLEAPAAAHALSLSETHR